MCIMLVDGLPTTSFAQHQRKDCAAKECYNFFNNIWYPDKPQMTFPLLEFFTNKHVCFEVTINLQLLTSFYNLLFMCIMFVGVLPAFLRITVE